MKRRQRTAAGVMLEMEGKVDGHSEIRGVSKPLGGGRTARPSGFPFNEIYVVCLLFLFDVLAMGLFFSISYTQAGHADPDMAQAWRVSDAIFCVGVLYMILASEGYGRVSVGNAYWQVARILVNATVLALLEWGVLRVLDLGNLFVHPLEGPLSTVSGGVLLLCVSRHGINRLLVYAAAKGAVERTIAVVGGEIQGKRLIEALRRRKEPWTRIVGIFDDRKSRLTGEVAGYEVQGTVDDLIAYARDNRVDDIIVALPWGAEQRLLRILEALKVVPANVHLAPDVIGHHFLDSGFTRLDGVPLYNIFSRPISGGGALLKRAEDLLLGGLILILIAPVMLICALAIRLDSPGPILFRQRRFGYNNKLIEVFKFRSMYHHMRDENASRLATQNDPRITRVGGFLRRTSLDELPQLFNVILGQMSLVGPRPHAVQAKAAGRLYQEVVREYAVRHRVKPGITGWAQVMGWRGETDTEEKIMNRVACDLYYMENWSIFLDIEILFRTVLVVTGKNVY